jgi:hypothetical protein
MRSSFALSDQELPRHLILLIVRDFRDSGITPLDNAVIVLLLHQIQNTKNTPLSSSE